MRDNGLNLLVIIAILATVIMYLISWFIDSYHLQIGSWILILTGILAGFSARNMIEKIEMRGESIWWELILIAISLLTAYYIGYGRFIQWEEKETDNKFERIGKVEYQESLTKKRSIEGIGITSIHN